MKACCTLLLWILACPSFAQVAGMDIVMRDSFPPFVKKVTVNSYLWDGSTETKFPMGSCYYELDSMGAWKVRVETFSDGEHLYDSVHYDPKKRTKTITRNQGLEFSKSTMVFNANGSLKSELSESGRDHAQLSEFEYDNAGRIRKVTETVGKASRVYEQTYDDRGRLLNKKRWSNDGQGGKLVLVYEEKYTRDPIDDDYTMYGFYYDAGSKVTSRDTVKFLFNDQHLMDHKLESIGNGKRKKLYSYKYDEKGRLVDQEVELVTASEDDPDISIVRLAYDTMGYLRLYVEAGPSYGFSNRWTTTYDQRGLPVNTFFTTEAEIFYYEWVYEYR